MNEWSVQRMQVLCLDRIPARNMESAISEEAEKWKSNHLLQRERWIVVSLNSGGSP
jgi:hypothetical protein